MNTQEKLDRLEEQVNTKDAVIVDLITERRELQAKLEALKPYIRHKSPCEFKTVGLSKCACGLLQALEQSYES